MKLKSKGVVPKSKLLAHGPEVYCMQVDERDRRYSMWMGAVCGTVLVYA